MTSPEDRRRYWRRNLVAVGVLLGVWFLATFGVAFYGRELGSVDFFGWPFSYWVGAQGALIVYLLIVALYARYMNRLDQRFKAPDTGEIADGQSGQDP